MADKCQVESASAVMGCQDTVCIHTKKICDSCIDKDCIEDLRVFLTQDSQTILDQATNVKARSADLLYVSIDVEPTQFNTGHFTVDITYYYRILIDECVIIRPGCKIPNSGGAVLFEEDMGIIIAEKAANVGAKCHELRIIFVKFS